MEIRRAKIGDLEGINKLLLQVLMVHHNGRPDIFKANAKKYTDNAVAQKSQVQICIWEADD